MRREEAVDYGSLVAEEQAESEAQDSGADDEAFVELGQSIAAE